MENLIIGYLGLILMMYVDIFIIAVIWKAIAKIKIPKFHWLGIFLVSAVIYIISEETTYMFLGKYSSGAQHRIAVLVAFVYLTVWTVMSKKRKDKKNEKQSDIKQE